MFFKKKQAEPRPQATLQARSSSGIIMTNPDGSPSDELLHYLCEWLVCDEDSGGDYPDWFIYRDDKVSIHRRHNWREYKVYVNAIGLVYDSREAHHTYCPGNWENYLKVTLHHQAQQNELLWPARRAAAQAELAAKKAAEEHARHTPVDDAAIFS